MSNSGLDNWKDDESGHDKVFRPKCSGCGENMNVPLMDIAAREDIHCKCGCKHWLLRLEGAENAP